MANPVSVEIHSEPEYAPILESLLDLDELLLASIVEDTLHDRIFLAESLSEILVIELDDLLLLYYWFR